MHSMLPTFLALNNTVSNYITNKVRGDEIEETEESDYIIWSNRYMKAMLSEKKLGGEMLIILMMKRKIFQTI